MKMRLEANQVSFGIEIPFDCFSSLALKHCQELPETAEIETYARRMAAQDFPESDVNIFIKRVCKWGNYPGISGRVIRRNDLRDIRSALQDAVGHLSEPTPNLVTAMGAVNQLKGLGSLSFASKHLRFLCPELCPTFDSELRTALPYSFNGMGYSRFAADCLRLAQELTERKADNPWPKRGGRWFAADVEAAIFQFVRSHK